MAQVVGKGTGEARLMAVGGGDDGGDDGSDLSRPNCPRQGTSRYWKGVVVLLTNYLFWCFFLFCFGSGCGLSRLFSGLAPSPMDQPSIYFDDEPTFSRCPTVAIVANVFREELLHTLGMTA